MVGGLVIVGARGLIASAVLLVFGLGFAVVGLISLASGRKVPCNCFGSRERSEVLGWRQVLQLPVWVGAAVLLATVQPYTLPLSVGRLVSASGALSAALVLAMADVIPGYHRARQFRIAIGR